MVITRRENDMEDYGGLIFLCAFLVFIIFMLFRGFYIREKDKKKRQGAVWYIIQEDETILADQDRDVTYLGWHPQFGGPISNTSYYKGSLLATTKNLIFYDPERKGNKVFVAPFKDMVSVTVGTKESISAGNVVLLGPLLGALYKVKDPFLLIGLKNELDEIDNIAFSFKTQEELENWFRVVSEQRIGNIKRTGNNKIDNS